MAAQQSLGSIAFRIIEAADVDAADARGLEQTEGAQAVVVVAWRDAAHLAGELRLHLVGSDRWRKRAVTFAPQDPLAERGRTLGLALAAMWPEQAAAPAKDEATPSRAAGPPAPRLPAASIAGGESKGAARPRPTFALGAAALGAAGLGGPASGLGAAIEVLLPAGDRLSLRTGASLRAGPVSALPGTDLVAVLAAGLEWWPRGQGRTGAGVRADLVAIHHRVTDDTGTTAETQGRSLLGADVLGQARLRLHGQVDLVAGLGLEAAFGATELRTGTTPVVIATIPALRAIAQVGVRVGF